MTSAEQIYEKLLKEDFSTFKDVSNRVSHDVFTILAEHLVLMFSRQQKLSPLLAWAVKNEVDTTNHLSLILREDSLSKAIVNRILFDNVGIKYLRILLAPMIKKIVESPRPLEISAHKVDPKEAQENQKKLIEAIDIFVTTFQESELSCPLIIRKLLMHLHNNVTEKFGSTNGEEQVPFSVHFFFFQYVCLAMVAPEKYNLVEDGCTDTIKTGLLNASKLLKDLAGQTERDGDDQEFIEYKKKNGNLLLEIFLSLVDSKNIQTAERILLANTTLPKPNVEAIQKQKELFIDFLEENNLDGDHNGSVHTGTTSENSSVIEDPESVETIARLTEEFNEKLNGSHWKPKKKGSQAINILKEKNDDAICLLIEQTVNAPLDFTAMFVQHHYYSSKFDSAAQNWTARHQGNNYRETTVNFKVPFPMTNRDLSLSEWVIHVDDKKILLLLKSNKKYPHQSGYVRAVSALHGCEFTSVGENETRIRMLFHFDPQGSMPNWISKSFTNGQYDKLAEMKKVIDTKFTASSSESNSNSDITNNNSPKPVKRTSTASYNSNSSSSSY